MKNSEVETQRRTLVSTCRPFLLLLTPKESALGSSRADLSSSLSPSNSHSATPPCTWCVRKWTKVSGEERRGEDRRGEGERSGQSRVSKVKWSEDWSEVNVIQYSYVEQSMTAYKKKSD